MRKPIIIGNWKMHKTAGETQAFIEAIEPVLNNKADYGIAVPYLDLAIAAKSANNLIIAAQNCFYLDEGAYTGEISAPMLKEININWVIVGHSERRTYFGETDETVNLKIKHLIAHKMHPILCIGETEKQYEDKLTNEVLTSQLHKALKDLDVQAISSLTIAYEPVWAIGTGKNANAKVAEDCCAHIRKTLREMIGQRSADIRIQYGGSVKADNIKEYLAQDDIDGALIGGASLKIDSFKEIIEAI